MKSAVLENDSLRAEFLPEFGGRMARLLFKGKGNGREREMLVPYAQAGFDPLAWPKCGMYPLAPYSNRIRDARMPFEDKVYVLPPHPAALPHTLHGCAHTLPWSVTAHDEYSLTMEVRYEGEHWPWPILCRQRVAAGAAVIQIELEIVNLDPVRNMPAGGGLHPFLRTDGLRDLWFDAGRLWHHDAECLPDGAFTALHGEQAWTPGRAAQQDALAYFSQWSGRMRLHYNDGELLLCSGGGLEHLVLFAPRGAAYLCVEPVSHLANAFAMPWLPSADSGTSVLAPGQALHYSMRLQWQAA